MLAITTFGWLVGVYLAPVIVALARRSSRLAAVVVLDVFLGWSIVGWIWALALAVKPEEVSDDDAARIDELLAELHACTSAGPRWDSDAPMDSVFVDGTYLISAGDDARTWAVCQEGRWGVVYERNGVQAVASWVVADDIPVHIRAQALRAAGVTADGGDE
jgi:hypothetical protein